VDRVTRRLIDQARSALDRLEEHLGGGEDGLDPSVPQPPIGQEEIWRRWWSLLSAVAARGGTMDATEFRRLGVEHGYDPRGLGGFFGGQNATMRREGETVELTASGRHWNEHWGPTFQGSKAGSQ
jgi:hypothetical protein